MCVVCECARSEGRCVCVRERDRDSARDCLRGRRAEGEVPLTLQQLEVTCTACSASLWNPARRSLAAWPCALGTSEWQRTGKARPQQAVFFQHPEPITLWTRSWQERANWMKGSFLGLGMEFRGGFREGNANA